jgi:UrcA family protein
MQFASPTKSGFHLGLVAVSLGLGISAAFAQSGPYSNGPTESIEVIAPRFRADSMPLNGPMEKVSYSQRVRYDDLDLLTYSGANALRWRVWRMAQDVCGKLALAYPVYESTTEKPCARTAYENGMVKAYGVINDARISVRYGSSRYGY